jgi:Partial alpha/beta-hydrolase lipase region
VTNDRRVRLSSAAGHLAPTPGQDEGHLLPQLLQWLRQSAKERAENGWFQVTGVPLKYVAASPGLLEDLSGYLQLKVDGLIGGVRFVVRRGAAFVVSKPHVQTAPLPLSRTLSTPPLHAATSYTSATCRIIKDVCGYPVETHTVRTLDGYLLVLVRIPRPSSRR